MANIQSNLNKIKNAVLGVDVRDSIHDGIKAINEEVENTTDRQVQLEGTFDELVINAGNSNAEVAAARVDSTGKSHGTLGKRLNNFDSQIKEKVNIDDLDYVDIKNPPLPYMPAIGDGVSDDTLRIQNLIDNFDNIFIPAGTFLVSTLNLKPGKHIFGSGKHCSVLKGNSAGGKIINCVCDSTGYEQYKIHDLKINGNLLSDFGIYICRTATSVHDTWANVYNLHITKCRQNGIYVGSQIRESYFDTIVIRDCLGNGITVDDGATDNVFTNIVSHNNEKNGFYINGSNNRFVSCKAFWNGRNNNAEQSQRYSGYYITKYVNKFTCCDAQENALHGFHIKDTNSVILEGMSADRNGLPMTDWSNDSPTITYGSGVYIDTSSLIEVRGFCRDFMKWSKGQTQKYGVTAINSRNINIDVHCLDVEENLNISNTSSYCIRVNGENQFHVKKIPSKNNKNNYFTFEDTSSVMGMNVYSDKSRFQIYSNNDSNIKIDSFKKVDGNFTWTGTPLNINNNGDIHLGRYNTKIGFFDVEGINRIQAPTAASDLASVVTLANSLRQILINYGLLG